MDGFCQDMKVLNEALIPTPQQAGIQAAPRRAVGKPRGDKTDASSGALFQPLGLPFGRSALFRAKTRRCRSELDSILKGQAADLRFIE